MLTSIYILLILISFLSITYMGFSFFYKRIQLLERKIITIFTMRSDVIPALYEVSLDIVSRHEDIFQEILLFRKREFSLVGISHQLESFIEVEQHIHHEINFIFQVCNKNQRLIKDKNFLYIRDIMIEHSSIIGKEMKKYNKIIEIYNRFIQFKNYSIIGFLVPFKKKILL